MTTFTDLKDRLTGAASAQWVATGMTAGLVYLPRTTRLAMGTLAALAGADMLQFAHAWLDKASS